MHIKNHIHIFFIHVIGRPGAPVFSSRMDERTGHNTLFFVIIHVIGRPGAPVLPSRLEETTGLGGGRGILHPSQAHSRCSRAHTRPTRLFAWSGKGEGGGGVGCCAAACSPGMA